VSFLLRDARLVDVVRQQVVERTSVLVAGGRIVATGDDDEVTAAARATVVAAGAGEAEVLDCSGRFLLPGLIDSHVHLHSGRHRGPSQHEPVPEHDVEVDEAVLRSRLHSFLYCGVTSVYDAGNDASRIYRLREQTRSGELLGPRVFCAGPFVTCTGGHGSGFGDTVSVDSLPGDLPALRAHFASRPDLVKITYDEHNWGVRPLIPVLQRDVLAGIVAAAHDAMLRVTVHVSNELRAREAIAAGADSLAHPVIQSPATPELAWMLAAKQIPVASTLAIGDRYVRLADDPGYVDGGFYGACLDAAEREHLRTVEHAAQRANRWADWMRVMTPVAQENLRALVAAGGLVATGTDLSLGPEMHRELELLQGAGIPPAEVLRAATLNGAIFLGRRADLGSVEAGKLADLLLVEEDPTRDVTALATIAAVFKDGEAVARERLDLPGETGNGSFEGVTHLASSDKRSYPA
jgi:imidazolonepropionase-like amidohydrolase